MPYGQLSLFLTFVLGPLVRASTLITGTTSSQEHEQAHFKAIGSYLWFFIAYTRMHLYTHIYTHAYVCEAYSDVICSKILAYQLIMSVHVAPSLLNTETLPFTFSY